MRPLALVGIFAALAPAGRADDQVMLKTYYPRPNTRVRVSAEEKTELRFTPRDAKEARVEVRTRVLEYEDEIQKVSDDNLVQKLRRHYTKAVVGTDGVETKLKLKPERAGPQTTASFWKGEGALNFLTPNSKKVSCTLDGDYFVHTNGQRMKVT